MMGQAQLREFLEAEEMSLTEFAKQIGRSVPLVWMLKNDPDHTPSLETALRIEAATAGAVKASCWVKASSLPEASARSTAKRKSGKRVRDRHSAKETPAITRNRTRKAATR